MTKKRTRNPGYIVAYRRRPRAGEVLAHNHVLHTRWMPHGEKRFRWFSIIPGPGWKKCPCGWRPDLGEHYAWSEHVAFWREMKKKYRTQGALDRHIQRRIEAAL
jgi:hypothetical protein